MKTSQAFILALFMATIPPAGARAGPSVIAPVEGDYVLPPVAFTRFCVEYPEECGGEPARVHFSAERIQTLAAVNRRVNLAVAPVLRPPGHAWALDVASGDCNDYAVRKRHELMAQGWPAGALSLAVVTTRRGEGHLVLTALTDAGDYVLDNLRSEVVDWRRAGYRWIMRQSARDPRYWVALAPSAVPQRRSP